MTFEVRSSWEAWPACPGDAGLQRPGAAAIAGYRDGELALVIRRWAGERSRWLSRWPSERSDPEPQIPTMYFADGSDARNARLLFERRGLEGEDHLLSTVDLRTGDAPRFLQELPDGPQGSVIEAMTSVVAKAWSASASDVLPDDEVVALPGPQLPGVHEDLAQRSWHLAHEGSTLRALEAPPIRDADGEIVRARRARLIDGGFPLSSPGLVVWGDGDVQLWRSGEQPLLDRPVPQHQLRPAEELLVGHLDQETASLRSSDGDATT